MICFCHHLYNPALPNIHKVLRPKQPLLHSTEPLHEIFKETPVVAYDVHQIFVTYKFARNFRTQEPPLNPTILLALSAATPNMDVSLAHTLIMKEQTTHLTILGKYEKSTDVQIYEPDLYDRMQTL